MTVFMNPGVVGKLPQRWRPNTFVPRQVVQWAEAVVGRPEALDERQEAIASAIAHVGYGATMGAIYGAIVGPRRDRSAATRGAAWGLLIWAAGYEGWMPAAGVRPATTHQPPSKWPVQIGNHIVYGVVTALANEELWERRMRRRSVVVKV